MGFHGLDNGSKFGLPPIGLPTATLETGRSDTERRQMPGLATKGSVFAWTSTFADLLVKNAVAAGWTETINLRVNAAAGVSSVDVPAWAAGCVVALATNVSAMGAGITEHQFRITTPAINGAASVVFAASHGAAGMNPFDQVVVPFFDEPVITVRELNSAGNTNGTVTAAVRLMDSSGTCRGAATWSGPLRAASAFSRSIAPQARGATSSIAIRRAGVVMAAL